MIGLGGPRTPLGYAPGYFATYTAWYHDITLYTIGAYHTRYYFNVRSKADRIYRTELITKVGKEKLKVKTDMLRSIGKQCRNP